MKVFCSLAVVALVVSLRAQVPAADAKPLAFEVASIKRDVSGQNVRGLSFEPGRFVATNVPVRALILFAYSAQNYQLVAAPDWVNTDSYDVVGKLPDSSKGPDGRTRDEDISRMVQRLLADRLNVQAHSESRDLPIYAITVARAGALGPALHKSDVDCDAVRASGTPPPRPAPGQPPVCGGRTAPGHIILNGFTLAELAGNLSTWTGRSVVDRTGLSGAYNLDLQWSYDQLPMFDAIGAPTRAPAQPSDPTLPSLFTAIQEQLGLKLDSTRGPVSVVVIDHIERPTDD